MCGALELYLLAQAKYSLEPFRDQQRESNHAVYSLYSREHLVDSIDCRDKGEVRFGSKCKMKISPHPESIKGKIRVKCSDKAVETSDHLLVSLSIVSTEVARVQASIEVDFVLLQELKLYIVLLVWLLTGVCYVLDPAKLKLGYISIF